MSEKEEETPATDDELAEKARALGFRSWEEFALWQDIQYTEKKE